MESSEMRKVIQEKMPNATINFADANYALADINWLTGRLYNGSFRPWLTENDMDRWETYFDCDNFAYSFFVFCQMCHARSGEILERQGRRSYEGIGVGVMYYITRDGGGHAINIVVNRERVYALEPQTGKVVSLTEEEAASCWFITI